MLDPERVGVTEGDDPPVELLSPIGREVDVDVGGGVEPICD